MGNDPNIEAASHLSPYLNFGQLSCQRAALRVREERSKHAESVASFLEEQIVRRELSDNFCHYQPHYDSLAGAAAWAQRQLVRQGKMHGFMRMYWAKKILEWTASPAEALASWARTTWAGRSARSSAR